MLVNCMLHWVTPATTQRTNCSPALLNCCYLYFFYLNAVSFALWLYDSNSIVAKSIDSVIKGHIVDLLCKWWKRVNDNTDNVLYVADNSRYMCGFTYTIHGRNVLFFFSIFFFSQYFENLTTMWRRYTSKNRISVYEQHTNIRRAHT